MAAHDTLLGEPAVGPVENENERSGFDGGSRSGLAKQRKSRRSSATAPMLFAVPLMRIWKQTIFGILWVANVVRRYASDLSMIAGSDF